MHRKSVPSQQTQSEFEMILRCTFNFKERIFLNVYGLKMMMASTCLLLPVTLNRLAGLPSLTVKLLTFYGVFVVGALL